MESTCANGTWTPSILNPPDVNIPMPSPLPRPDSPEEEQIPCGCLPYDMVWTNGADLIDYDPNTLPGTDFICSESYIDDSDPTNTKFILRPSNTCRLFCDSYHAATMACDAGGKWTGAPELGAWWDFRIYCDLLSWYNLQVLLRAWCW